jgi:hypothetical protein
MKNYLKTKRSLASDNYELAKKAKYFEDLNVDGD